MYFPYMFLLPNHFFCFKLLHLFQRVIHHGAHLVYTEPVYHLDRIAFFHDSGSARGLKGRLINELDVLYLHPQSGEAVFKGQYIVFAAQCIDNDAACCKGVCRVRGA